MFNLQECMDTLAEYNEVMGLNEDEKELSKLVKNSMKQVMTIVKNQLQAKDLGGVPGVLPSEVHMVGTLPKGRELNLKLPLPKLTPRVLDDHPVEKVKKAQKWAMLHYKKVFIKLRNNMKAKGWEVESSMKQVGNDVWLRFSSDNFI